jgi:hypothetical protein
VENLNEFAFGVFPFEDVINGFVIILSKIFNSFFNNRIIILSKMVCDFVSGC